MQHEREQLDGLSQPHVVGEDATQPVSPQERKPVEPSLLIGPQFAGEPRGYQGVGGTPVACRSPSAVARQLMIGRQGFVGEVFELLPEVGV